MKKSLRRKQTAKVVAQAKKQGKDQGKARARSAAHAPSDPASEESAPEPTGPLTAQTVLGGLVLLGLCIWSYWPTLIELVDTWNREPDYSHGYLVLPLALYFLWDRRASFPGWAIRRTWPGLLLVALSVALRYGTTLVRAEALDGWTIGMYVAGVVWLLGGWRVMWWAMPSILFLFFMLPLPYRAERLLSLPLQGVATKISTATLQILGQPAIAEGHTILLGDVQMEIAEACSGLRIFVGIMALAFVYFVLVRRAWWEKGLLLLSVVPIALIANATRIVVTGLLFQYTTGEAAHKFSHDLAGWLMIPYAAALFWLVLWYLEKLFREVELTDVRTVMRESLS